VTAVPTPAADHEDFDGDAGADADASAGAGDHEDFDAGGADGGSDGGAVRRAPWHFKILAVGTVIYLGWRLYQGIGWLVHHV
jgi:hypothetical protein